MWLVLFYLKIKGLGVGVFFAVIKIRGLTLMG